MFKTAFCYAWEGSWEKANSWAPLLGGVLIWAGCFLLNVPLAMPTTVGEGLLMAAAALGTAWVVIFLARLLWWPWGEIRRLRNSKPVGAKSGDIAEWHVYDDIRKPKLIRASSRVGGWTWYYQNTIVGMQHQTGKIEERVLATFLFLVFDAPPAAISIEAYSTDISLPIQQVEFFTPQAALISFEGKIPTGTLGVRLV